MSWEGVGIWGQRWQRQARHLKPQQHGNHRCEWNGAGREFGQKAKFSLDWLFSPAVPSFVEKFFSGPLTVQRAVVRERKPRRQGVPKHIGVKCTTTSALQIRARLERSRFRNTGGREETRDCKRVRVLVDSALASKTRPHYREASRQSRRYWNAKGEWTLRKTQQGGRSRES